MLIRPRAVAIGRSGLRPIGFSLGLGFRVWGLGLRVGLRARALSRWEVKGTCQYLKEPKGYKGANDYFHIKDSLG